MTDETRSPATAPRRRRARPLGAAAAALGALAVLAGCASAPTDTTVPARVAPPAASDGLTAPDVDAWLDGLLPTALDDAGIAGAVVSVVDDGRILTVRGYGDAETGADGEPPVPVDPQSTLFRVGSVSKTVTATAVMALVERGELDLDADVAQYLDFAPPESETPITLRHLLTHTAGFEESIGGLMEPTGTELDLREFVSVDPPRVVYEPGTVPAYSNYGYSLAGYIVERVSGRPFAEVVDEAVLAPSGMTSSTFAQPLPGSLAADVATGYPDDSQPGLPFELVGAAPAGSFSATAPDMARFMLAQLGEQPAGRPVLRPETLAEMQSPALDESSLGMLAAGPRMALGLFDDSRDGRLVLGHGGDTRVFHSAMEILPEEGAGIFLSMNSTGRAGEAQPVRAAVMDGFVDRYFPADGNGAAAVEPTSLDHAREAEGVYESSRAARSTFATTAGLTGQVQATAQSDGTLVLDPGLDGGAPDRFEETAPWVFTEVGGGDSIAMRVDDGRVTAIGYESAFALLPAEGARDAGLAVPVVASSLGVLLLGLLAAPVGWLVRRWHGVPAAVSRPGRAVRVLTRVGAALALAAAVGWLSIITGLFSFQPVSDGTIRGVQAMQALAAVAVVPAAVGVVTGIVRRDRVLRTAGRVAVLAALVVVAGFAVVMRLLSLDITY